jgi:SAM-dependent MidA family methyltransferase
LGQAIAAWLGEIWSRQLGRPLRWHIIEVGGGDGALAQAILRALPRLLRWRLSYHLVEISGPARDLQRQRLGRRVTWASSPAEALEACDGVAVLLSNELVDAFPATVLQRDREQWWEVHLEHQGGQLREVLKPAPAWLARAPEGRYSATELASVASGARVEIHRRYRQWLHQWAPSWRRGALLTIDYGGSCRELYGRRREGTMRAYWANLRLEERADLYHRLGQQDLTCDVNFTDLTHWGHELGWSTEAFWTQRDFLERYVRGAARRGPAYQFLTRPGGAGTCFRVLWQKKGC